MLFSSFFRRVYGIVYMKRIDAHALVCEFIPKKKGSVGSVRFYFHFPFFWFFSVRFFILNSSTLISSAYVIKKEIAPFLQIEAWTLRSLIKEEKDDPSYSAAELFRLSLRMADGLQSIHDQHVVLSDIKTDNILLQVYTSARGQKKRR